MFIEPPITRTPSGFLGTYINAKQSTTYNHCTSMKLKQLNKQILLKMDEYYIINQ